MRRKLLISFIIFIVVLMASFVLITNNSITKTIESQYEKHFKNELNLVAHLIELNDDYLQNPEQLYKVLLKGTTRLTIIDQAGVVLVDSSKDVTRMDNHINRPEVVDALDEDGFGRAIRYSDTLRKSFIYVAKRVTINGETYYIRLADPIDEIAQISANNIKTAIWLALLASLVAAAIGIVISNKITKPIQDLIHSSDLIARGQYNKKIYVSSNDEVGQLAESFNTMRKNLSHTMNALTTRNAELQAILNSMASGIIAVDINENIILINQQCFDILNLPESVVSIHDSVYKVVKNQKIVDMIKRSTSEGHSTVAEIVHPHIDKILKVHVQPIRVDNREIMGTMIVIDDITQIRRLEGMRSEFVSNVTHELKTPLTSILGFVDTLKDGAIEDRDKAVRFLDIIENEAERLNRLISDILLLSEIENTVHEKEHISLSMAEIIQEVVDMLSINVGDKPIDFRFVTKRDVTIAANRDRIKQLMINLIDNAIKYTEAGHVHIHLYYDDKDAIVKIEDTGMGFDASQQVRLFERFYRIDKARSRKYGGTGLGLSIAKHIVNLYKGEIKVKSARGVGTTFTVLLPRDHTLVKEQVDF